MDIQQPVSNERNGKEKTDQDGVKAGEKKDGPSKFEKVIKKVDDRPSSRHGNDSEDEVFDLKLLSGNPCRPKRLDQILNSPINAHARKKGDQSKEEQKDQWLLKEQAVIENTSQFFEPSDIDLESQEESHQDRQWDDIKEEKPPSPCPSAFSLKGKEKREMKKE